MSLSFSWNTQTDSPAQHAIEREVKLAGRNGRTINILWTHPVMRPRAGVLFLHPATSRRQHFREEMLELARFGTSSISIEAEKRPRDLADPDGEVRGYEEILSDLSRGVSFLLEICRVPAGNIAFFGQNQGAALGACLAGVEKRISAFILRAGIPNLPQYWTTSEHGVAVRARIGLTDEELALYRSKLRDFEAHRHLSAAGPAAVLLQYGLRDDWFSREDAEELFLRTSEPKEIRWYEEGHDLQSPEVIRDSHDWLRGLGFFG